MVIEEHEMSIRLEMFFVQFDSLLRQHVSFPPFFIYFALFLQSHSASVVFPIPQDYWTNIKKQHTNKFIIYTSAVREPGTEKKEYSGGGKEQRQISIFVEDSHCYSGETTSSVRWKCARLTLGLNLYWRWEGGTTESQHFLGVFIP